MRGIGGKGGQTAGCGESDVGSGGEHREPYPTKRDQLLNPTSATNAAAAASATASAGTAAAAAVGGLEVASVPAVHAERHGL